MTDRRFIEESFPVKEVGEASAREKNIRHGHISTLHIWWARRPLAASRATAYAALTPAPRDIEDWQKKRDFIIQLCQWENSNNQQLLEKARQDILEANGGVPPKVLDPFSGGGSYPLEAMRLGCEAYANDYNPVAVLIEKATLEYPQKYGRPFEGMPVRTFSQKEVQKGKTTQQAELFTISDNENSISESFNPLVEAVKYWGNWVLENASKELTEFYPPDSDGSIPVGYLWARTIPCQNPACGTEIPLMRQFWLAKKENKKVALFPEISNGTIRFHIIGDGYEPWPNNFEPERGTISRAVVTCPFCGAVMDDSTTRSLFHEGKHGQRLVCIILSRENGGGKTYRKALEADYRIYLQTGDALQEKRQRLMADWGIDPIPDELIPTPCHEVDRLPMYGMPKWGDGFNLRQKLALIIFTEKVRQVYDQIIYTWHNQEFALAITTYLALNLDRLVSYSSSLGYWHVTGEKISPAMQRQSLAMVFDYAESNPFADSFSWNTNLDWILRVIAHCSNIQYSLSSKLRLTNVTNSSATNLPYQNDQFDIVLTDPPYYDNVNYSALSDFYYVWLKRSVGNLFPDLFSTPLVAKTNEIISDINRHGDKTKAKAFFEENLTKAFLEIYRVLKSGGITVIVYAHKSTTAWETVVNALLDSGLVINSAWPIKTEMQSKLLAHESAVLLSSIYIVARKIPRLQTGFYNDVRNELRQHLDIKLHRLWEEGISGADFFIAAIGSAIEVFGKYEQVIDFEGNVVRADRLLEEVRNIATDYAVRQILHNGIVSEISDLVRLYVLWRWNYGEALVPFDEGRKLAQSCGVDLAQEWNKGGFIKKEKEFIRLLGPQQRKLEDLEEPRNMIDVLHKALLLWEKGKRTEMVQALVDREYGKSEAFYRVAQAISETLPNESKEKKLLDGFLAGRERVQEEVGKAARQGRLWE